MSGLTHARTDTNRGNPIPTDAWSHTKPRISIATTGADLSDDAFHRGDLNPPMRDGEAWIRNDGFPPIREGIHTTKTDL